MTDCALLFSSPRKPEGGGDAGVDVMEVPGSVELPGLMLPIAESPEEAHLRHQSEVARGGCFQVHEATERKWTLSFKLANDAFARKEMNRAQDRRTR
jgi:hypothetical protein